MNRLTAIILSIFCILFLLISLPNHYLFRTYALDLGMFNHALYSFSQFKKDIFTLDLLGRELNYFGDHFSPIMLFLAPFRFLGGSYTLLIIQAFAILAGGYGIYKYARIKGHTNRNSLLLLVLFFCIWGIYAALSFDFHANVLAAMMLPWLLYFYEKNNKMALIVLLIFFLFCKESMGLWGSFIFLALSAKYIYNFRKIPWLEMSLALFSFVYFFLSVSVFMPWFAGAANAQMYWFSHLGSSFTEIIAYALGHPVEFIQQFYSRPDVVGNPAPFKLEFYRVFFLAGGVFLFFRPVYLLMALPVLALKMLSNNEGMWGIGGHYSIEYVPLIVLAVIDTLTAKRFGEIAVSAVIACLVFLNLRINIAAPNTQSSFHYNNTQSNPFHPDHYRSALNTDSVYKSLNLVPDNAKVSTSSILAPHLAARDRLYSFPVIRDAEYLVLVQSYTSSYPLDSNTYMTTLDTLKRSANFTVLCNNEILIVRKK